MPKPNEVVLVRKPNQVALRQPNQTATVSRMYHVVGVSFSTVCPQIDLLGSKRWQRDVSAVASLDVQGVYLA